MKPKKKELDKPCKGVCKLSPTIYAIVVLIEQTASSFFGGQTFKKCLKRNCLQPLSHPINLPSPRLFASRLNYLIIIN